MAMSSFGLPSWLAVLLAMLVCTVLGILIEGLRIQAAAFPPVAGRAYHGDRRELLLQNSALLIWGASPKGLHPVVTGSFKLFGGQLTVSYVSLLTVAACVVIMLALTAFTAKSKMGKAMRACSEDKSAAQLGYQRQPHDLPDLRYRLSAGGGGGCAAVLLIHVADADDGSMPGIKAFTAAVFGG